eukprot:10783791-Alexandrium_andersonii.AAC.1
MSNLLPTPDTPGQANTPGSATHSTKTLGPGVAIRCWLSVEPNGATALRRAVQSERIPRRICSRWALLALVPPPAPRRVLLQNHGESPQSQGTSLQTLQLGYAHIWAQQQDGLGESQLLLPTQDWPNVHARYSVAEPQGLK